MENEKLELTLQNAIDLFKKSGIKIATAESCTAGWIGKTLTDPAGSSDWFDCGFITYSNSSKCKMLGVDKNSIVDCGAVSEVVAKEMAFGALKNSGADISVAVSGIAGPGGGSDDKPVGTVCFAWCKKGGDPFAKRVVFKGDRNEVRLQTVTYAIEGLMAVITRG